MKIYKFGGASVKDADGVKNVAQIISINNQHNLLVVISAMGKTTNALERLVNACYHNNKQGHEILQEIKTSHQKLINELLGNSASMWMNEVENLFLELECLIDNNNLLDDYDFL
jgi:aspartate kinase